MAKCNTQANDKATTANNWKTPGASVSGHYIATPAVTGKGHRKIAPKAKHFSHFKKDQSSRPNQTDNSKRLAKITQSYIKEFREDSNISHR